MFDIFWELWRKSQKIDMFFSWKCLISIDELVFIVSIDELVFHRKHHELGYTVSIDELVFIENATNCVIQFEKLL